jgi:hypothetical protein
MTTAFEGQACRGRAYHGRVDPLPRLRTVGVHAGNQSGRLVNWTNESFSGIRVRSYQVSGMPVSIQAPSSFRPRRVPPMADPEAIGEWSSKPSHHSFLGIGNCRP